MILFCFTKLNIFLYGCINALCEHPCIYLFLNLFWNHRHLLCRHNPRIPYHIPLCIANFLRDETRYRGKRYLQHCHFQDIISLLYFLLFCLCYLYLLTSSRHVYPLLWIISVKMNHNLRMMKSKGFYNYKPLYTHHINPIFLFLFQIL